ncbi:MAG TPA: hypothetical protein ENN55_03170, partial [Firmicutes bacterium]|nr:hypothetical protein [Bacillota bacterium]
MANTDIAPWLWLVPTLTVDYSSTAQPLTIDDERFLFSQWLDIYLSYGLNFEIGDNFEIRGRGFNRKNISQQAADEPFGKGLYDSIDTGFYAEGAAYFILDNNSLEASAGFKYIDRRFPNYTTLLSDESSLPEEIETGPNT